MQKLSQTEELARSLAAKAHIHLDGADAVRMKWDVDSIS